MPLICSHLKRTVSVRDIRWIPPPHAEIKDAEILFQLIFQKVEEAGKIDFGKEHLKALIGYCGGHFRTLERVYSILSNRAPSNLQEAINLLFQKNSPSRSVTLSPKYFDLSTRSNYQRVPAKLEGRLLKIVQCDHQFPLKKLGKNQQIQLIEPLVPATETDRDQYLQNTIFISAQSKSTEI